MVSFLKFAVSTLHVWEKGGNCAFTALSYEVFSLGTFTVGTSPYCFALVDVSTLPAELNGFRHDVWPLAVMLEMIACAVVLGYAWSAFWGDREFPLELYFPSCIGRALGELRASPNVEVVRFRGGDRDIVNRATPVFHSIGRLPLLKRVSIDNYPSFPLQALTAILRGLGRKQLGSHGDTTKGLIIPARPLSKLQSLELHVEELTGTPDQLVDLCAQIKGIGCSSLRTLRLYFGSYTVLEPDQIVRNENTLRALLGALKHHPSLQELELKAPLGSTQTQPTNPILDALIAVIQTCSNLKRLRLNLWSRQPEESGDQDTWYIAPLAKALSQPSFYTKSNLASLELLLNPSTEQGATFVQSLEALEHMVRSNPNISHLFVGLKHHDEECGDASPYDNMLCDDRDGANKYSPKVAQHLDSTRLYVTLNRLGRKRLLSDPRTTRQDWIQAILQDKDDISITFCWISMHPSVLPLGSREGAAGGTTATGC